MGNDKTMAQLQEEQDARLRAGALAQRSPQPHTPRPMDKADLHAAMSGERPAPLRAVLEQAQRMTLWEHAEQTFGMLKDISDHCRRTANEHERNLMELESMLGKMPKRP